MRPLRCLLAAAALAVLTTAPRAAHAQDARAKALFEEGMVLFQDGKFPLACPKFEESLKLFNGLGTRGKLAECYEKAGRLASAYKTYKDVARLAGGAGDTTRERVAGERARLIEPKLSYLTVTPPTVEIPGLVVRRNGKPVEQLGTAEAVDSGLVQVEATAPGRKPFTAQVMLTAGQTSKLDLPALEPATTASRTAPAPAPAPSSPPAEYKMPEPAPEPASWQKPTGLVLGAAGLATMGVGAFVGFYAKSKYDKAFDEGHCDRGNLSCDDTGQGETESARRSATTATVLVSVGGAALIGGVVLYLTAPRARPTAIRIAPSVSTTGAGLSIAGAL